MNMTRPIDYCHANQAYGHMGPSLTPRPRGGLMGGAVILSGNISTPGGSSGYGYLGMDITDSTSWPRPYAPTRAAYYCFPVIAPAAGVK